MGGLVRGKIGSEKRTKMINSVYVIFFWQVIKINPTTGKLLEIVEMPATYVTSVAFGGPDFDVLYVTTSKLKLKNSDLIEEPLAGSVFAVYGLGGQGLPANKFEL